MDLTDRGLWVTEVEEAEYQANLIERSLAEYEALQRLAILRQRLSELEAQPDGLAELRLRQEINLTAAITLDYAHRLYDEVDEPLLAAAEYRRVWDEFPGTSWAEKAQDALARYPRRAN